MGKKKTSKNPNVWVSPRNGQWVVQREGSKKPSRVVDTKQEAIQIGREIARSNKVELITQKRDGTIQSKDSYGNDPNPPKDKEH